MNDMKVSTSQKITRLFHFGKRFFHEPGVASYDLLRYFFLKLPNSIQTPLRTFFRGKRQSKTNRETYQEPPDLITDITTRFHVSKSFVELFRQQDHGPMDWSRPNWEDFFENLPPIQKLSVPFAMSTVIRGHDMLSLLETQSCIRKKDRYLDVGTGYGGFLRAAKEVGFKEVVGIELQPDLVALASANIHTLQGAEVITGDFLKDDLSGLEKFDLITCNDVIEHVDDPELAIRKMSHLVNENGCLCFEVPNKDAIPFVKSDGHFLIFGITQLSKNNAAEYYSAVTGADQSVYFFEMGEMYELEWYLKELTKNGMSAFVADTHSLGDSSDAPALLQDLKQTYEKWKIESKPKLDEALAHQVTSSVEEYIKKLEYDYSHLDDRTSKIQFKNKYLRSFWTIIAMRNSSSL